MLPVISKVPIYGCEATIVFKHIFSLQYTCIYVDVDVPPIALHTGLQG